MGQVVVHHAGLLAVLRIAEEEAVNGMKCSLKVGNLIDWEITSRVWPVKESSIERYVMDLCKIRPVSEKRIEIQVFDVGQVGNCFQGNKELMARPTVAVRAGDGPETRQNLVETVGMLVLELTWNNIK